MSYTAGTFSPKLSQISKKWVLVDARGLPLGRLAARIALILRGKNKPSYAPHLDCGDNVVVINAASVVLTGKKADQNKFYWHTGYPGGIKERSFGEILNGRYPERLLKVAVRRMLPKESPLARKQLKNLYIYPGDDHAHTAQKPELLTDLVK